jgi:hypothetical protein
VTKEQAKQYLSALLHGDPDARGIVMASARDSTRDSIRVSRPSRCSRAGPGLEFKRQDAEGFRL